MVKSFCPFSTWSPIALTSNVSIHPSNLMFTRAMSRSSISTRPTVRIILSSGRRAASSNFTPIVCSRSGAIVIVLMPATGISCLACSSWPLWAGIGISTGFSMPDMTAPDSFGGPAGDGTGSRVATQNAAASPTAAAIPTPVVIVRPVIGEALLPCSVLRCPTSALHRREGGTR